MIHMGKWGGHLGETPALSFDQMLDVLMSLYGVREAEQGRFAARLNKVRKAGVPIGANVEEGPGSRYSLDQFFQLLVVIELAELSIPLSTASLLVRNLWPGSEASLSPAQAWLGIKEGGANSILLLAFASEMEGFAEDDDTDAGAHAARRSIVAAAPGSYDRLAVITSDQLFRDGRFDLTATSPHQKLWRASIVDMSTLVPLVVQIFTDKRLVSEDAFSRWVIRRFTALPGHTGQD